MLFRMVLAKLVSILIVWLLGVHPVKLLFSIESIPILSRCTYIGNVVTIIKQNFYYK